MLMRKRGEMFIDNAIGLILAAAVTFILVMLMITLFSSTFNKGKEGSDSYLNSLERAIDEVDESGRSDFFMLDLNDEELEFYLVYFGEALIFVEEKSEIEFVRSPKEDSLCICYRQGERVLCDDCIELGGEVLRNESAPWVVEEGESLTIVKKGDAYAFS